MTRLRTLVFAVLLVPLSACLEVDTRVLVKADGSGTLTERIELKGPLAQMIQRMGADATSVIDQKKVEQRARALGRGVKVSSLKPIPEHEGIGAEAVFTFEDVNELRVNPNPTASQDSAPAIATSSSPISFSFEPGPPAVLVVGFVGSQATERSTERKTERGGNTTPPAMIKQILEGMRIAISVAVAGQIIETNASYRDGNSVILMELDFDKILANPHGLQALQSQSDSAAQDMKSALRRIPGMKVEPQAQVKIVFVSQQMASHGGRAAGKSLRVLAGG